MTFRFISAIAAALISSSATAQSITAPTPVDGDWFDYQIRWTEGAPSYSAKWMLFVNRGQLVVCGSGAHRGGQTASNNKILEDLALFVGDKPVVQDLTFFETVKTRKSIVGSNAACIATGQKASDFPSKEVSLRATRPLRKY